MDRPATTPDIPTADRTAASLSTAGVRISGADRVLRSAAGGWVLDAPLHRPAPHHVHRPKPSYPDDLRDAEAAAGDTTGAGLADAVGGLEAIGEQEPVWEGASRMLTRLAVARRLHPAGRARSGAPRDATPS